MLLRPSLSDRLKSGQVVIFIKGKFQYYHSHCTVSISISITCVPFNVNERARLGYDCCALTALILQFLLSLFLSFLNQNLIVCFGRKCIFTITFFCFSNIYLFIFTRGCGATMNSELLSRLSYFNQNLLFCVSGLFIRPGLW